MNIAYYNSPIGIMRISDNGTAITEVQVIKIASSAEMAAGGCEMPSEYAEQPQASSPLAKDCIKQLTEYFAGDRKTFDLPLDFSRGTEFQQKVWKALVNIPYGKTETYAGIAKLAGSPGGCRAAGNAVGANPFLVVVPCHRVIKTDGSIGGFGAGLAAKRALFDVEGLKLCGK